MANVRVAEAEVDDPGRRESMGETGDGTPETELEPAKYEPDDMGLKGGGE